MKKSNSLIDTASNTSSSNSVSQIFDSFLTCDIVWLMYQLINMFFESQETNIKYFEQPFRPINTFMITFECMIGNTKSEKVCYLLLVHEYLAK
jgi:hypothetical protein